MSSIRDYLPRKEEMKSVQAKLPKDLVEKVQQQMKADNVENWNEFLKACFRSYLDHGTPDPTDNLSKRV